jgi:hypothetical protein
MKTERYKCPGCESHSSREGLVCPVHDKLLEKVTEWASGGRFRQVGDVWVQSGLRMVIPEGQIDRDNGDMKSTSMGCPNKAQQKEWQAIHAKAGIKGTQYNPKTGALHFRGGRTTQRQLMKIHDLHDNN